MPLQARFLVSSLEDLYRLCPVKLSGDQFSTRPEFSGRYKHDV